MSGDLDRELARLADLTDAAIRDALAGQLSAHAARLASMLEYHLGWRDERLAPLATPAPAGKKLRPGLVLLVAQASSPTAELTPAALNAAAAVELLHNFSLVHDDIQDRSEL